MNEEELNCNQNILTSSEWTKEPLEVELQKGKMRSLKLKKSKYGVLCSYNGSGMVCRYRKA